MFELVQPPQWPPKRPERSGFLAISIFCIMVTIGFVARNRVFINSKHPESKNAGSSDQPLENRKRAAAPDVEIRRWQAVTNVPAPKRVLKCRCHIDTQIASQSIDHHSSQFAMCTTVTQRSRVAPRFFLIVEKFSFDGTAPNSNV
jgi:hypothetical protein